jgi:hypothetical protein
MATNKTTGSEYLRSEKKTGNVKSEQGEIVVMSPIHASVNTPPTVPLKKTGQPRELQAKGVGRDRKKRREKKNGKKRKQAPRSCTILELPSWSKNLHSFKGPESIITVFTTASRWFFF